jgi:PAS domain S-box-containing protein
MKILVVEDDRAIAQTLQLLLSSYDYAVDIASSGEAGLEMIDAFDYDLVLLDLILPKLDGISVCQQLRAKGLHIPILVLTGQEGQSTRLSSEKGCATALNAGADDYISKPFETKELMARVQALLRRREASNQPTLTWGHLSIDPGTRSVTYGDRLVPLTPKEYAILELFLHNPQKIFSSHAILDYVWNAVDSPGEESVRVHIKGVRHKLTEAGAPKDLIKTIHRVGYRLNPIYSSRLAVQTKQLTALQIAELKSVNEELRKTLEELYVTREELRQQNEQLEAAHRTIELERQQYRDLFELAPDAYIVTDMYGMIQAANQAASALFQIDVHDLVNQPLITWVAKSDRHTLHSQFTNLNTASSWEINIQPQEGEPLPVLVSITKIKDSQVGNTSLCWLLHDIRPRKAIEQQLQAAYNELEMRVAERTVELNAANQALQQQYNQWRSLFQHIQVAIAIADDEGQFVDANPPASCSASLKQNSYISILLT